MGEMEQSMRQMVKMMEEESASLAKKAELCKETRPDLVPQIEEFCSMYHSLSHRYHHLTAQLLEAVSPQSPLHTPDQKLPLQRSSRRGGSASSGDAVSDLSFKEGSESFSPSSSSDSESDSFNSSGNAYFSLPMNTPRDGLQHKIVELGSHLPIMQHKLHLNEQDCADDAQDNSEYEDLIGRITKYEEELRVNKERLQLSEDEIVRLKMELERSEFRVQDLQTQLQSANIEIKVKEGYVEVERKRALEVEQRTMEVTNDLNGQLDLAEQEISMLKAKLDSQSNQVLDLQEKIDLCMNNISDRDDEINALKVAHLDAQEKFCVEKANLQSEILILTEKQSSMEARLEEWELQGKSLEDKLRQSEASKMEMKGLYETQEAELVGEISQLKVELADRGGHVEALNEDLDKLKLECDVLMAEKDWMAAKINTLIAEVGCRDDEIRQKEEQLQKMHIEHKELIVVAEGKKRESDELRTKVMEMEKEVDRQRDEILAGAEEKREAIRQLCFSLDHYRSGYKQLCKAFVSHRRHAVMAS